MQMVLIIDDELKILTIYTRLLVEAGYVVRWASDATRATNILLREGVDLVLLDLKMPRIDGKIMYGVIQEFNPRLKIIVSSVYSVEKQKQIIPMAFDYFDKSESPMMLLSKIQEAFHVNNN